MHARYPGGMGRVLLLLACDINDEVCDILADELENPGPHDPRDRAVEHLPGERGAAQRRAPRSVQLFDPRPNGGRLAGGHGRIEATGGECMKR